MLHNATLLRADPPPPSPGGPAVSVRCTLAAPTGGELQWLAASGVPAGAVLYLPLAAGAGAVAVGYRLHVALDGRPTTSWRAVHVADRVGGALRYARVFLGEEVGP